MQYIPSPISDTVLRWILFPMSYNSEIAISIICLPWITGYTDGSATSDVNNVTLNLKKMFQSAGSLRWGEDDKHLGSSHPPQQMTGAVLVLICVWVAQCTVHLCCL